MEVLPLMRLPSFFSNRKLEVQLQQVRAMSERPAAYDEDEKCDLDDILKEFAD